MAHEQQPDPILPPQPIQQLQDHRLHRNVQRRRRLIQHQQPRPRRDRPRNPHPRLLPARKLMRKPRQQLLRQPRPPRRHRRHARSAPHHPASPPAAAADARYCRTRYCADSDCHSDPGTRSGYPAATSTRWNSRAGTAPIALAIEHDLARDPHRSAGRSAATTCSSPTRSRPPTPNSRPAPTGTKPPPPPAPPRTTSRRPCTSSSGPACHPLPLPGEGRGEGGHAPTTKSSSRDARVGEAATSRRVYAWRGARNSAAVAPSSTTTPALHHRDPVAVPRRQPQIMRDQDHRHPPLGHDPGQQLHHRLLRRHIQPRRRLVRDQQRRLARDRHRDHHPLAHPPRQLMRIRRQPPLRLPDHHRPQQPQRLRPRLGPRHLAMRPQHVADLLPHRPDRVQRRPRVLKDHRDRGPAHAAADRPAPAGVMSRPWNITRPPKIRPDRSSSRMIASAVTDLPDPLSPTTPASPPPRAQGSPHAAPAPTHAAC